MLDNIEQDPLWKQGWIETLMKLKSLPDKLSQDLYLEAIHSHCMRSKLNFEGSSYVDGVLEAIRMYEKGYTLGELPDGTD